MRTPVEYAQIEREEEQDGNIESDPERRRAHGTSLVCDVNSGKRRRPFRLPGLHDLRRAWIHGIQI